MLLNGQLAGDPNLAAIVHKADSETLLEPTEQIQYAAWVRQFTAQANMVLGMYDQGLATASQVRGALAGPRAIAASSEAFRREIERSAEQTGDVQVRDMILDEAGLDMWLTRND